MLNFFRFDLFCMPFSLYMFCRHSTKFIVNYGLTYIFTSFVFTEMLEHNCFLSTNFQKCWFFNNCHKKRGKKIGIQVAENYNLLLSRKSSFFYRIKTLHQSFFLYFKICFNAFVRLINCCYS